MLRYGSSGPSPGVGAANCSRFQYVVADEQRVLHGTGGNFECLQDKCNDEQARDQHASERGQKFDRRFARLFVHRLFVNVFAADDFFFLFYGHVHYPFP